MKPIVVIESPYKAHDELTLRRNLAYARALVEYCALRGDAPVCSHLLLTQALDDRDPAHRRLGIEAGLELLRVADKHVVGIDLGITDGIALAIERSPLIVERVSLPEWQQGTSDPAAFAALIARYEPKWHVHGAVTAALVSSNS